MKTFWDKLDKPFFVLAPMANVTDSVFRKLFAKYGKPDVTWTEFVSADGLVSPGRERLLVDLEYSKKERPIVAQLFTGHPEAMKKAAALARELGFDGVDINMGCPDRAVEKQGGGANLIRNPKTAIQVLEAARIGWLGRTVGGKVGVAVGTAARQAGRRAQKGAFLLNETVSQLANESSSDSGHQMRQSRIYEKRGILNVVRHLPSSSQLQSQPQSPFIDPTKIPISVKTRLGYNVIDLNWLRLLLEQKLPALTIHLRTRKEMSEVAAHWELMPEIIKLRNEISPETLIIGNGDVDSLEDARAKCKKYGCDGVMIGRGIFGKPWFFAAVEKTPEERLKILLEHTKAFEKAYCGAKRLKSFAVMKKHFKAYVNGWDNAKDLRAQLMETNSYKEVEAIVRNYLKNR